MSEIKTPKNRPKGGAGFLRIRRDRRKEREARERVFAKAVKQVIAVKVKVI